MGYNIHIQINRVRNYTVTVKNPLTNNVTVYEPFDTLSKKFNRYNHKILYKSDTKYEPSDYDLCLDDPNAWYYYYILFLYKPIKKIVSVDIFFLSSDKDRINPLLFGFNYENEPSVYYTYYHLRGLKKVTGSIGPDGLIKKEDLITRLIDERGLYESESQNKFIIRLGDKPNDTTPVLYPQSGQNKERITLQQSELQNHENYVKYEHIINKLNNVHAFYIAFHQDTLYLNADRDSGKLREAEVFFNKYDDDVPVVVVFRFERRIKVYRFSDFDSDVANKTKNISGLRLFSDVDLVKTLNEEYKRVKKELVFLRGRSDHKYISITSDRYFMDNKDQFRRAKLRPNLDSSKGGDPTGPYVVYSYNLFKKYTKKEVIDRSFDSLHGQRFSSIYVYYTADNQPLLVGFIGESENKFFRITKGGKSWERDEDNIKTYHISHLYPKLIQLEKEKTFSASDLSLQGKTQLKPPGPKLGPGKPSTSHPSPTKPDVQKYTPPKSTKYVPQITSRTDSQKPFNIDISITNKLEYDSGWIMVSEKQLYRKSNLFCYFTHTLKNQSEFTISSITYGSLTSISIINFKNLSKVKYVSVYFNINELKKPLILEFYQSKGQKKFFANIFKTKTNYIFSSPTEIQESKLVDELIKESDRINERNTFRIDQIGKYNDINVSTNKESGKKYVIYTHSVKTYPSKKSDILFENNQLIVEQVISSSNIVVQNKTYENIKAYALEYDLNFQLVIELKEPRAVTYLYRKDLAGTFKKLDEFKSTDTNFVMTKLSEIYYFLSKSVIVEITRKWVSGLTTDYDMNLIVNKPLHDKLAPAITEFSSIELTNPLKKVKLLEETLSCKSRTDTSIKCYSHDISELVGAKQDRKISGIRLYIPRSFSRFSDMVEVELYKKESVELKDRHFIYFLSDSYNDDTKKKVYVYFFVNDLRPLLIKYNDLFYRPLNDNNIKWYHDSTVDSNDVCKFLGTLKEIHGSMRVKLIFVQRGSTTNARVLRNLTLGKFKKDTFNTDLENKYQQLFTLPKNVLIHEQPTENTNLEILFEELYTKPFDTVNVYSNQPGTTLRDIILIEFINESKKIHLKRRDGLGNYWVKEEIKYDNEKKLQQELESIQSSFDETIVYEIDQTDNGYSRRVSLYSDYDYPTFGFNKYIHMASNDIGNPQKTLILYNGTKLVTKHGDRLVVLEEIVYQNFNKVTAFSIADSYNEKTNFPLLIELNSGDSRNESNIYYYHRRNKTNYFWEKIDFSFSTSNVESLSEKLYEVKFELYDSIVLLMDKTMDRYGGPEINGAINDSKPIKDFNLALVDTRNIGVNRAGSSRCLSKSGFRAYGHELKTIFNNTNCGLRFFTQSHVRGKKYAELSLYNYNGRTREYLFYNLDYENVYFYFYGDDPRPLLLCYGDRAYRATSTEYYQEHKWFRDERISDCLCRYSRDNPDLIKSLSEVVCFLNPVNIAKRPLHTTQLEPNSFGSEKEIYDAYNLNGVKIQIKVTYENRSCYRVYNHESIGFNGSGIGYRLGDLTYDNNTHVGINYTQSKTLIGVSVYYNLFDFDHNYPLLVSLRFYDDSYEYYELGAKSSMFWNFIEDHVDEENVEKKAYDIYEKLKINFDRKKEDPTLFNRDACKEGGNTVAVIGGSVGGVVGTAAVGGGVTLAVRPELLMPVINALT